MTRSSSSCLGSTIHTTDDAAKRRAPEASRLRVSTATCYLKYLIDTSFICRAEQVLLKPPLSRSKPATAISCSWLISLDPSEQTWQPDPQAKGRAPSFEVETSEIVVQAQPRSQSAHQKVCLYCGSCARLEYEYRIQHGVTACPVRRQCQRWCRTVASLIIHATRGVRRARSAMWWMRETTAEMRPTRIQKKSYRPASFSTSQRVCRTYCGLGTHDESEYVVHMRR